MAKCLVDGDGNAFFNNPAIKVKMNVDMSGTSVILVVSGERDSRLIVEKKWWARD
jgi:hypothetical protein